MFKTFIRCSHHLKDKKDKVVNYAQKIIVIQKSIYAQMTIGSISDVS